MQIQTETSTIVEYGKGDRRREIDWSGDREFIYEATFPYLPFRANQPLFRYMEFWKFEDLIKSRQLYFLAADRFRFPLEGSLPNSAIRGLTELDLPTGGAANNFRTVPSIADEYRLRMKGGIMASCWHMGDDDILHMWNLSKVSPESVFVFTTAGQLMQQMQRYVVASPVRYGNSESDGGYFNVLNFLFHNDEDRHLEQEFRLLTDWFSLDYSIPLENRMSPFVKFPLDLSKVINSVVVHPDSPPDFRGQVEGLVGKFLPGSRFC